MLTQERKRQLLEDIANRHEGVLRPEDVVKEASTPGLPGYELRGEFDWNDASAAHAHRLEQARTLIRSVKIEIKTTTTEVEVVHYVRDPYQPTREGGYVSVSTLFLDRDRRAQAVTQEFARAASSLRRARDLALALGEDAGSEIEEAIRVVDRAAGVIAKLKIAV